MYYQYRTLESDTFDSIALDFYNDEFKATDIIKLNPHFADVILFEANIILKIPVLDTPTSSTLPPWKR
ncbi:tail protein X [Sedimentibacter acidaminivorans]